MKCIKYVLNFTRASEYLLACLNFYFKERKIVAFSTSLQALSQLNICVLLPKLVISITDLIFLKDEGFTAGQREAHLFTSR